ncbi:MAG: quinone-dependent dihydroorotate dehydrogenase [Betaproteobacteria bacterium]
MLYRALRPFLFSLDPETAHRATLKGADWFARLAATTVPPDPVRVMGIDFPNPVGLAAGLDKDAAHIDALAALGFGFIEAGTVTPRPQPGNPKPRIFRLPQANAIINRFGFNNVGVDAFLANVARTRWRGVLGINIGKNFDTPMENAADDYVICLEKVYQAATYVTVNISSPNTKGLRGLQEKSGLDALLGRIIATRERLAERHGKRVPLALKIAPDLDDTQIADIAAVVRSQRMDAVIATNTSTARDGVERLPHADEQGGLSGEPIRERATAVLAALSRALAGEVPLIGAGGILCGADAREKFAAGASLVQIYTGLIYRGPALVAECAEAARAR